MEHMLIYDPVEWMVVMDLIMVGVIIWLASLISLVNRHDLPANERTFWLLVVVLVPGIGAVMYWAGRSGRLNLPRRHRDTETD